MKLKIALCDDEILQVELTRELILSTGLTKNVTFIYTNNGKGLLKKIENERLDIIILDTKMDGLSGIEIAEKIREIDKNILIIFITEHKEYAVKAYDLNAFS